jgi:hypothetical protein
MEASEITSFTPSELLDAMTKSLLKDRDNFIVEEYLDAYSAARRMHPDLHAQADPTAARIARQQMQRML